MSPMSPISSPQPPRISRSTVELFLDCPCCFHLQMRHGIRRPAGFPFTLNNAVDRLLKAEFDAHRHARTVHPLLAHAGHPFVPFNGSELAAWRANRKGVSAHHGGYTFYGLVDDVWQDPTTERLCVADYKATAKAEPVTALDPVGAGHHRAYIRQLEFYTWLIEGAGHLTTRRAYLVYTTGDNTRPAFQDTLHFRTHLIEHVCDLSWIPSTLDALIACLESDASPSPSPQCGHCQYVASRAKT